MEHYKLFEMVTNEMFSFQVLVQLHPTLLSKLMKTDNDESFTL